MITATETGTHIERESREVRPFFVRPLGDDGSLVDPTSLDVEVGFARLGDRPTDWKAATWDDGGPITTPIGSAYVAKADIGGPDTGADIELVAGVWRVFVRVTADIEQPVIEAGVLTVR